MTSSLLLMTFLASLSLAGGFRGACPAPGPPPASPGTATANPVPDAPERVVQLNHADAAELCTLPGVGPARAEAILRARVRRPFARLSDLGRVKGLGPKRIEALAGLVGFDPPPPPREGPADPG